MSRSSQEGARRSLLGLLLAANCLLYGSWPTLRAHCRDGDSSDPFCKVLRSGETSIDQSAFVRSQPNLDRLGELLHENRNVLLLGTSETIVEYNLAAQMNALSTTDPRIYAVAFGGLSPIHRCLPLARNDQVEGRLAPTILLVNLVYFTKSHDVINDGWLSRSFRSPAFVMMNHMDVNRSLDGEVIRAYRENYALKRPLLPLFAQEYLGNLVYLQAHQPDPHAPILDELPIPVYAFDDVRPDYDEDRNVRRGYRASDRLMKSRWVVNEPGESFNLKAVKSSMRVLGKQTAPVLYVVLPVNRRFYEYNGLDMGQFDRRYDLMREELAATASKHGVRLLDLYEAPDFEQGFRDRMHNDAYGNFQLATATLKSPVYRDFVEDAKRYFEEASADSGAKP